MMAKTPRPTSRRPDSSIATGAAAHRPVAPVSGLVATLVSSRTTSALHLRRRIRSMRPQPASMALTGQIGNIAVVTSTTVLEPLHRPLGYAETLPAALL